MHVDLYKQKIWFSCYEHAKQIWTKYAILW